MNYLFAITTLAATAGTAATQPASGSNIFVVWAAILLGIGVILFIIELFVPSAGIIGLTAATCVVAGIVLLFKVDTTLGLISAIIAVCAVPFFLAVFLKVWPNTPVARMLTLGDPRNPDAELHEPINTQPQLIGKHGQAVTDLRPVGTCLIDGQRMECVADGSMIRTGSKVTIISADGLTVKVRLVEQE